MQDGPKTDITLHCSGNNFIDLFVEIYILLRKLPVVKFFRETFFILLLLLYCTFLVNGAAGGRVG